MILTVIMLFAATAMSTVVASGAVVKCCEADLPLVDLSGETNRHAVVAPGIKTVYQEDEGSELIDTVKLIQ